MLIRWLFVVAFALAFSVGDVEACGHRRSKGSFRSRPAASSCGSASTAAVSAADSAPACNGPVCPTPGYVK